MINLLRVVSTHGYTELPIFLNDASTGRIFIDTLQVTLVADKTV
jgi:hypothetical protein